ncbi:glycoside hydrolase family 16 protein [Pedobacter immunditicola]|uniref:glycoside hydrolase family 16 protein n=1 Tax=Pedobacter immunditicola TaxID=3133440 RepID=UPI00309EE2EB
MKSLYLLTLCLLVLCSCSETTLTKKKSSSKRAVQSEMVKNSTVSPTAWKLVFSDEFNSTGNFDTSKWMYCKRQTSAWNKYLTSNPDYVCQDGGNVVLKMDNAVIDGDPIPYHSGGIQTSTKFSFRYGKVEVRAKFKRGQGSWPAIWMMPELPTAYGGWPKSGEIDIMEQVNYENVIHQTIHNGSVTNAKGASTATHATKYNTEDYNTYAVIWSPSAIEFYVNNVLQYTYSKVANATPLQWPFDKPFYLILNQAGGAGWPGAIKNADLPFEMKVDWVRIYKLK